MSEGNALLLLSFVCCVLLVFSEEIVVWVWSAVRKLRLWLIMPNRKTPAPLPCPGCGDPPFTHTLPHGEGEAVCRRCGVYVQAGGGLSDAIDAWNEGAK